MQSEEFIKLSKTNIIKDFYYNEIVEQDVLLVWFCKTVKNFKAIFTTKLSDGKIFEATYNGVPEELYIDEYTQIRKKTYKNKDEESGNSHFKKIEMEVLSRNKENEPKYDTLWQY